jgi:hypothetical protein
MPINSCIISDFDIVTEWRQSKEKVRGDQIDIRESFTLEWLNFDRQTRIVPLPYFFEDYYA